MPDVDTARGALPALSRLTYLNSGTAGPLPQPVVDAILQTLSADAERGRVSGRRFGKIAETRDGVRTALAALVHTRTDRVVLTTGTVDGLRLALSAVDWSTGDTVVATTAEHPDTLDLIGRVAAAEGLTIEMVPIGETDSGAEILDALHRAVTAGVRAMVVSHVAFATGAVLPIREITELGHTVGATVLVDGAQAVGALDVDATEIGADYYAFSGQKWLLGPEGTGALVVGNGAAALPDSAARSNLLLAGLNAAIAWRTGIGAERQLAATLGERAERARRALAAIEGVDVVTPADHAGLVSFRVDGHRADAVALALGREGIATRAVNGLVRASFGFFTTDDEVDLLVSAVATLAAGGLSAVSEGAR